MTTPATFTTRVTFDHVRNTAAGFTAANPILGYGVIGLETDTGKIKVGNGVAAWSALPYSGGGPVEWSAITGKPSTFAPATHTHVIADVTGLQAALDGKATPADVTSAVAGVIDAAPAALNTLNELAAALGNDASFASTVTNALAAKAPLASPTFTGTVSGVTKAMVGLGNVDNTTDAAKPISTATQTALDAKAAAIHTHVIADVTGLQSALDGKQAAGSYAAAVHTHGISDITGLQSSLDGKAASSHTHTASAVTDFTTAAAAAAPVQSVAGRTGAVTLAVADVANAVATSDSRLSDQRVPTDGSVTDAKIATAGLSAASVNWAAIAAWAPNTAYSKGELVSFRGVAYRRSVAGTTGATFNAANWQQITPAINVVATASELSSWQNDYALPAGADIVRVSATTAVTITGVAAGWDGQAVLVINTGSNAITLAHASTSSAAGNRFAVPWLGSYVMDANGGAALLVYDSTSSVWRVV